MQPAVSRLCTEVNFACSIRPCNQPISVYLHGRGLIERDGVGIQCRVGTTVLSGPSSVTVVDDTTVMCNSTTSYPDTQTLDVAVSIDAGAHWTRLMPGSNVVIPCLPPPSPPPTPPLPRCPS